MFALSDELSSSYFSRKMSNIADMCYFITYAANALCGAKLPVLCCQVVRWREVCAEMYSQKKDYI